MKGWLGYMTENADEERQAPPKGLRSLHSRCSPWSFAAPRRTVLIPLSIYVVAVMTPVYSTEDRTISKLSQTRFKVR
jgi:hypothetical protein